MSKSTVVARLQPRNNNKNKTTPSSSSAEARSTRSRGTPTHYVALEGAPSRSTTTTTTARKRGIAYNDASDDESDGDEILLASTPSKKKKRARPTAATTYLPPSPARSNPSPLPRHDSDEERVTTTPTKPKPSRQQLATPETTPITKKHKPSPLKPSSEILSDSERDDDDEDEAQSIRKRSPAKRLTSTPKRVSTTTTTTRTPTRTPTTTNASRRRASSSSVTPSRASLRKLRLPPNVEEIKNAPKELRNRLVGFHMDDEGYGDHALRTAKDDNDDDEDASENESDDDDEADKDERRRAKGKGRAIEADENDSTSMPITVDDDVHEAAIAQAEKEEDPFSAPSGSSPLERGRQRFTLPTPPAIFAASNTTATDPLTSSTTTRILNEGYDGSFVHRHIERRLSVLTGATLPEARVPLDAVSVRDAFDPAKGVMRYPYLEGGYSEWEKPLRATLDEVVTRGTGNAIVLLGPRGVGKTMLIERTLRVIKFVHRDRDFVTVRLSGLVHTTDRLALRSIAMQLREQGFSSAAAGGEFDDLDEGDYSSNSATMSTLLRMLEPPTSSTRSSDQSDSTREGGGASSSSSSSSSCSKPIVLIVDEFDLFAQHPRQSFLYCLLDIVQGNRRRGGVGVVGVSSRVDCLSLLEKRVRSRCQSHVLQMMLPSSLSDFLALAKRLLSTDVRLSELSRGGGGERAPESTWARRWNQQVDEFVDDKKVRDYFERVWRVSGNVPTELRGALVHFLSRLDYKLGHSLVRLGSDGVPRLEYSDLEPRESHLSRDVTLKGLSSFELTVLIACQHLSSSTVDFETGFNLEMAFGEYVEWTKSIEARGKRIAKGQMSRDAFSCAFDTLRRTELVLPLSTTSTVSPPAAAYATPSRAVPFKLHRLVVRQCEIKREVELRRDVDGELKKWASA